MIVNVLDFPSSHSLKGVVWFGQTKRFAPNSKGEQRDLDFAKLIERPAIWTQSGHAEWPKIWETPCSEDRGNTLGLGGLSSGCKVFSCVAKIILHKTH